MAYNIQLPDGQNVEIDDAVDQETARRMIMQRFPDQFPDTKGFTPALKSAGYGALADIDAVMGPLARQFGNDSAADFYEQRSKANRKDSESGYNPTALGDIGRAYDEKGLGAAAGTTFDWLKEQAGSMIGRYGPPLAVGAVPVVGPALSLGALTGEESGANIERQKQVGAPEDLGAALSMGLVQGAIDKFGFGKMLSGVAAPMAERAALELTPKVLKGEMTKEAAIDVLGGRMKYFLSETGANAALGAGMNTATEATRRLSAGQDLTSPDAMEAYGEGAAGAAALSPFFGAGVGMRARHGAETSIRNAGKAYDDRVQMADKGQRAGFRDETAAAQQLDDGNYEQQYYAEQDKLRAAEQQKQAEYWKANDQRQQQFNDDLSKRIRDGVRQEWEQRELDQSQRAKRPEVFEGFEQNNPDLMGEFRPDAEPVQAGRRASDAPPVEPPNPLEQPLLPNLGSEESPQRRAGDVQAQPELSTAATFDGAVFPRAAAMKRLVGQDLNNLDALRSVNEELRRYRDNVLATGMTEKNAEQYTAMMNRIDEIRDNLKQRVAQLRNADQGQPSLKLPPGVALGEQRSAFLKAAPGEEPVLGINGVKNETVPAGFGERSGPAMQGETGATNGRGLHPEGRGQHGGADGRTGVEPVGLHGARAPDMAAQLPGADGKSGPVAGGLAEPRVRGAAGRDPALTAGDRRVVEELRGALDVYRQAADRVQKLQAKPHSRAALDEAQADLDHAKQRVQAIQDRRVAHMSPERRAKIEAARAAMEAEQQERKPLPQVSAEKTAKFSPDDWNKAIEEFENSKKGENPQDYAPSNEFYSGKVHDDVPLDASHSVTHVVEDTGDPLAAIMQLGASTKNPIIKQVAKIAEAYPELAPNSIKFDHDGVLWPDQAGAYDHNTDSILLHLDGANERVVAHEYMHALTSKALMPDNFSKLSPEQKSAVQNLKQTFDMVKNKGEELGLPGHNGFKNVREFVAEAFTNPAFQKALADIPVPGKPEKAINSMWDKFVRAIGKLIGWDKKQDNMLSMTLRDTAALIEANKKAELDHVNDLAAPWPKEDLPDAGQEWGNKSTADEALKKMKGFLDTMAKKHGEGYMEKLSQDEKDTLQMYADVWQKEILEQKKKSSPYNGGPQDIPERINTNTPEFKKWFGDSVVKDENGKPQVWLHGTAQDISIFMPKQAGAIFVTRSPTFAENFSNSSKHWMLSNIDQVLTPEQIKKASNDAFQTAREKYDEGDLSQRSWNALKDGDYASLDGFAKDLFQQAAAKYMPSSENIMPVYVKAERPFDYANEDHVAALKQQMKENGSYGYGLIDSVRRGSWQTIEDPNVQHAIKQLGHDSFYMSESGSKNLAVYSPTQIKSVNNRGPFSPDDARIDYAPASGTRIPYDQPDVAAAEHNPGLLEKAVSGAKNIKAAATGQHKFDNFKDWLRDTSYNIEQRLFDWRLGVTRGLNRNATYIDEDGVRRATATELLAQSEYRITLAQDSLQNGYLTKNAEGSYKVEKADENLRSLHQAVMELPEELGTDKQKVFTNLMANLSYSEREGKAGDTFERPSHVTDQMIAQALDDYQNIPEVKKVVDMVHEMNMRDIDFMEQTSLIGKELAAEFRKNKFYIPLDRVLDDENKLTDFKPATGGTYSKTGDKFEGSERKVRDAMDTIIERRLRLADAGIRNDASYHTIKELQLDGQYGIRQVKDHTAPAPDGWFKVKVLEEGKPTAYLLNDKNAYLSLRGLKLDAPEFINTIEKVTGAFRNLIVISPDFVVKNMFRDNSEAWMANYTHKNILSTFGESFGRFGKDIKKSHDDYDVVHFGLTGNREFTSAQREYESIIKQFKSSGSLQDKAARVDTLLQKLWDKAQHISGHAEVATRQTIFGAAKERTGSETEAIAAARNLLDFRRRGDWEGITLAKKLIPFFNSNMQGFYKYYRMATHGDTTGMAVDNALRGLAIKGMYMAAATTAYAAFMQDHPGYQQASQSERDNFWLVPLPGTQAMLRVPIPYEVGAIFKTLPEVMFNKATGKSSDSEFKTSLKEAFKRTFPQSDPLWYFMPQYMKPAVEVATNHNSFFKRPIERPEDLKIEPGLRTNDRTTPMDRGVAAATGLSPVQANHLIRGYLGTIGGAVASMTGALDTDKPSKPINQTPMVGSLLTDPNHSRDLDNYYGYRDKTSTVKATVDALKRRNDAQGLQAYLREKTNGVPNAQLYAMNETLSTVDQQLSTIRKAYNAVDYDKTLNPIQKRQRKDQLREMQAKIAAQVTPQMRRMMGE